MNIDLKHGFLWQRCTVFTESEKAITKESCQDMFCELYVTDEGSQNVTPKYTSVI